MHFPSSVRSVRGHLLPHGEKDRVAVAIYLRHKRP